METKADVVIIGAGAGGLVSASGLAQLGLKVILIEKQNKLGGDCLHYGCVPSKSLIHCAKVAQQLKTAHLFGLDCETSPVEMGQVNQYIQQIIDTIQVHDDPKRFEAMGVEVLFANPTFLDKKTILISGQKIQAKRFILAMGSSPNIPALNGLDTIEYLTNETVFNLPSLPEHLLVLGGGVIGVELGQAFARLGSKVTILEKNAALMPRADSDARECLQAVFAKEGIQCVFNLDFLSVEKNDGVITIHARQEGQEKQIHGSHLLVATGRRANVQGLNLEAAGVQYTDAGVQVNKKLKTKNRRIYAVGDVVHSPYKYTHMAEYHAGIVIANIAFKLPKKVSTKVIPSVIFSEPQIATVGLSEQDLLARKAQYETLTFDFKDNDKAITQSQTVGFAKFFIKKGKILGAVIIGSQAGELIGEVALAMQADLKIGQISATIHAYPTLSQIIRRCINQHYAPKLFNAKTKKLVRFLQAF